jgi:hypothetical protein
MDISEIKYARSGDLNIAYQRFGSAASTRSTRAAAPASLSDNFSLTALGRLA